MKKDSGFTQDSKPEAVKDLGLNNIVSKIIQAEKDVIIEFDKSLSDKFNFFKFISSSSV